MSLLFDASPPYSLISQSLLIFSSFLKYLTFFPFTSSLASQKMGLYKCSGLVHWEDPEESGGEGGGRGDWEGEHM